MSPVYRLKYNYLTLFCSGSFFPKAIWLWASQAHTPINPLTERLDIARDPKFYI